jgi:hypothetical protein
LRNVKSARFDIVSILRESSLVRNRKEAYLERTLEDDERTAL